jgi:exodeoxyribonuclease VII large subunit
MRMTMDYKIRAASDRMQHVHTRLLSCSPAINIRNYRNNIERLQQQAQFHIRSAVEQRKSHLSTLASTLNVISPLQTLSRGYSITSNADGQAITNTDSVSQNELINTRLHSGQLISRIEKIIRD